MIICLETFRRFKDKKKIEKFPNMMKQILRISTEIQQTLIKKKKEKFSLLRILKSSMCLAKGPLVKFI